MYSIHVATETAALVPGWLTANHLCELSLDLKPSRLRDVSLSTKEPFMVHREIRINCYVARRALEHSGTSNTQIPGLGASFCLQQHCRGARL